MLISLATGLLALAAGTSDVYFEQRTTTVGLGAQAETRLSRVWFAGQRMRMETGATVLLVRLDRREAYRLEAATHTAWQLDLDALQDQSRQDLDMAGGVLPGGDEDRARLKPLPGGKRIAGYECQGFQIAGPVATMQVWASPEVPLSIDAFSDYLEWTGAKQALGGLMDRLRELPGFPLETATRVDFGGQVIETKSSVLKLTVAPQPASLFEIPRGYTVRHPK